ncbi:flavin monoamine oxidase family protein [Micromonospora narathiwatensis]|uniref:Monoamine oxidase n=1 Tax=Micromonospora narathiwatensis TaxID=299146 RepID=A0A1A8ZQE8_9ACTN|nr:NAD(P)/FAD-dependent oxidoreductase [Micromonospora narathiwatensis]SBT46106.1 monoamine oxidase [Micromonospora narathiwatensis]
MGSRGRTQLTSQLRATFAAHAESERTGIPVDEVIEMRAAGLSRRRLLGGAAVVGAAAVASAAGLPRPAAAAAAPAPPPSVTIVGAGLAGIRAAHWLYKVKGIRAAVYEGSSRIGGRCHTLRGFFDDGVVVEHGGAFINTEHNTIRSLANNLGLSLRLVNGGNQPPGGDKYWIDGANYPYSAANADWGQVYQAFKSAVQAAPYPQRYDSYTAAGLQLDNQTVNQWLDANIPGGLSSRFAKLMQSNVVAEYGMDPDQQSALNLIYLLGWNGPNSLAPLTGGDEKYTIIGGNDQLLTAMVAQLPAGTVTLDRKLVAVKANANGSVTCTFQTGTTYTDVTSDKVILALPFTTLRECDLSRAGFSTVKMRSVNEFDLGSNAKLHVQFTSRPWVAQGYGGSTYTNVTGFQCAWDDAVNQSTTTGVLCEFPGGSQTRAWTGAAFGAAPAAQVTSFLNQLEPIYPGITAAYNGRAYRDAWPLNPWSKGAYSSLKPGQSTRFFGVEATREGNVHFAGEHTSVEYFGYLNGAVESGERAAKEVAGP